MKVWIGRVLTALAAFPFLMSFSMKLMHGPQIIQGMQHLGWPEHMIMTLAILEATAVILYLIPPVSVLGAIILTGYLGGAMATHLRIGEPVSLHIVIGLAIWGGLYLRDSTLRELIPIRAKDLKFEREITIDRSQDEVFSYLKPLKNFGNWNPFLKKDPQARSEERGTDGKPGFVVAWEGNKQVGAGEQEITRIIEGERVDFELRFKKPFAATNQGYFATESLGSGKTKVKWGMTGKSVFPMSLIGLFIDCEKTIAKDFDEGLSKLKAILEK